MLHSFLKWEFELTKENIFKLYLDVDRYDTSDDEDLIKQLEVYMKGI